MLKRTTIFELMLYILLLFCTLGRLSAQDTIVKKGTDLSEFTNTKGVFRVYLPYPALEGEFRLGGFTTMHVGGFIGFEYQSTSINGAPAQTSFISYPVLTGGINQYVNVKRRASLGKRIDKFSADYLYGSGMMLLYQDAVFGLSAGYGLNRNIKRLGF